MNLYLIGYRGTGKSTVAARLGERLGWTWVDADVEVERRAGKSIADIFAEAGEEGFRQLESDVLTELSRRDGIVVGVGGGGVLREANVQAMRNSGKLVWLKASPATIGERISSDPATQARRPNLTNAGGLTEIEQLLAERTPIYRQAADLEVDTEGKDPACVAAEILAHFDLQTTRPPDA